MSTDPYIESVSKDPANPRFQCRACKTQGMANYEHHIKSTSHQQNVARFVTRLADKEQLLVGLDGQAANAIVIPVTPLMEPDLEPQPDPPDIISPPSPLSLLRLLDAPDLLGTSFRNESNPSDDSDGHIGFERLRQALQTLENLEFDEDENNDPTEEEESQDPHVARAQAQEAIEWHPFKSKEHVAGLLIIGSPRHLISRAQYQIIRSIIRICDVKLPEWGTLRALKERLWLRLDMALSERTSPSGIPLFGLTVKSIIKNELANPIVSPHLVFVPELPQDEKIDQLSQSQKWRECYSPELRVQMVVANLQHFYIYEPVELQSGQLVVPIFFYQHENTTKAKCLPATIQNYISAPDLLNIIIPQEPPFDSDDFYTLDVEMFGKTFKDITLENGVYSRDLYGINMY